MVKKSSADNTSTKSKGRGRESAGYDVEPAQSESGQIHVADPGMVISRNRLGGAGAVELRRRNRLDVFGDIEGSIYLPPNPFDLSAADEFAADKLTATLVAPRIVRPFRPFTISWEVAGPSDALSQVNSYQLNLGSEQIFGLSAEPSLTPDGLKVVGSAIVSMWQSRNVRLWAHFGSGIRELAATDVTIDTSNCTEERTSLVILSALLQSTAAEKFVESVQEEAGGDVTVNVLTPAVASFQATGFTFHIDIEMDAPEGTLTARLGMEFRVTPKAGNLGATFYPDGYRSVDLDADPGILGEIWLFITLGEPNLISYQNKFSVGLKALADRFASAIGRSVRGLPEEVEDEEQEAQAPKAIATAIDMANGELVVTLCPVTGGLVAVGGIVSVDMIKLE